MARDNRLKSVLFNHLLTVYLIHQGTEASERKQVLFVGSAIEGGWMGLLRCRKGKRLVPR